MADENKEVAAAEAEKKAADAREAADVAKKDAEKIPGGRFMLTEPAFMWDQVLPIGTIIGEGTSYPLQSRPPRSAVKYESGQMPPLGAGPTVQGQSVIPVDTAKRLQQRDIDSGQGPSVTAQTVPDSPNQPVQPRFNPGAGPQPQVQMTDQERGRPFPNGSVAEMESRDLRNNPDAQNPGAIEEKRKADLANRTANPERDAEAQRLDSFNADQAKADAAEANKGPGTPAGAVATNTVAKTPDAPKDVKSGAAGLPAKGPAAEPRTNVVTKP